MKMSDFKVIIQARSGSTRLPNKMNLPFYNNETILDIIISGLLEIFDKTQIILATTRNVKDDLIVNTGNKYGVTIFRGDEHNVLDRFIQAGILNKASNIIRVCADNPFISNKFILELINRFNKIPCNYLSFKTINNTPSIKTHFGFFAEITTLDTLMKVSGCTKDPLYLEHVTNYIYTHPKLFHLEFLNIPVFIENADIRLTVDTLDDFNVCKEIYTYHKNNGININPESIINYIQENKHLTYLMLNQINLNKK